MTIRETEDSIRYLDHEMTFVWENEGHLVFKKQGGEYEITFTEEEVLSMKGGILTHNHPYAMRFSEVDPRSFGHSFSEDDIFLACCAELSEIRAVTRKLRFSMKPSSVGWNRFYWAATVSPRFQYYYDEVWAELNRAFNSGTITSVEAHVCVLHETWLRVSEELDMMYLREMG